MKITKKLNLLLFTLVIVTVLILSGIGVQAENPEVVLRAGLILPPDHAHTQAARRVADILANETDSNIELQVYPANQLGTAPDLIEGLSAGTVDVFIGATTWLNFLEIDYAILGTFYLFDDQDMCREVHLGSYFAELADRMRDEHGIIIMTQDWDRGGRNFVSTEEYGPILTPEDLEGMEVRSSEQEVWLNTFRLAGAEPTPIAFEELFMGLQQGIIDGMEGVLNWVYDNRYYEAAPHISLTNHNYEQGGFFISEQAYEKLNKEQRSDLQEALNSVTEWHNDLVEQQINDAIESMEEEGAQIHEVDRELWQDHFREILWPDLQEEIGFSAELLNHIQDKW